MSKFTKLSIFFTLFIFIIASISSVSFAAKVNITDENFKASLQKLASYGKDNNNFNLTIASNQVLINTEDGNYTLNYDLTDKPTFTYKANITQGMSYKEFQEKTGGNSSCPMIGFATVANVQGVEFEDSIMYYSMCLLASAFSNLSSKSSYIIVDDTNTTEGVTIVKDNSNPNTIYASEFGEHVMEHVNSMYGKKQTYKDESGINSLELTTELQNVTDTSCDIVTTLIVNPDADFDKIKGYSSKLSDAFSNNDNNNEQTQSGSTYAETDSNQDEATSEKTESTSATNQNTETTSKPTSTKNKSIKIQDIGTGTKTVIPGEKSNKETEESNTNLPQEKTILESENQENDSTIDTSSNNTIEPKLLLTISLIVIVVIVSIIITVLVIRKNR